jgi:DNA-binding transcriptional LysR family regulator
LDINVRTLRYVETVARLGSFTKASAELRVAQPALSIAIKKLEEQLRVALFVRQARHVVPTPEGLALIKRAERIFLEMDAAQRELQAAADLEKGEVRVGLPPMYGLAYLPELITSFHQKYPGIIITAVIGSADEIRRQVEDGAIDLGLLEARRIPDIWKYVEVGQNETVLCVHKDHPLARRKKISGRELDNLPIVAFDHSFLQRQVLDKRCKEAGVQPRIVLQSNFVPLIVRAVSDGLGAATLLRSLIHNEPNLVPISFEPIELFRFSICWRDDHFLSRAGYAFIEHAREQYSFH